MPQSLVQIYLHIVFSTKNRLPTLKDIQVETYSYLAGICKNLECPALIIGGAEDHIHLLTSHSKNKTIAEFLRDLKRSSSKWIKTLNSDLTSFSWQNGYGAFSISATHIEDLKKYIANQKQHHNNNSFKNEFRRLCKKYDVAIDERYVWN
jgi:putative transposase